MTSVTDGAGAIRRKAIALACGLAAFAAPATVLAGSCPADKTGVDVREMDPTPAKDVSDVVVASIDLTKEPIALKRRHFRLRRLEIKPGGVVPWHSHGDRPAIIYVLKGSVTEYASTCSVPIVHEAGEATPELHGVAHWWRNTGDETAVILSSDLFPIDGDEHMM